MESLIIEVHLKLIKLRILKQLDNFISGHVERREDYACSQTLPISDETSCLLEISFEINIRNVRK